MFGPRCARFRRLTLALSQRERGQVFVLVLPLVALVGACLDGDAFDVVMQDSSMEPTLVAGTAVRFRPAVEARRGDVIAFEYPFPYPGRPRRELIARVIALPGDQLELGPNGVVVNAQPLDEPYAKSQQEVSRSRLTVPAGAYFVLGDDRNNQRDSRWWGPLAAAKLLGVAEPPR